MTYDGQSDIVVLIIGDGSRVDRDRVPALEAKTDREVQLTVLLPVDAAPTDYPWDHGITGYLSQMIQSAVHVGVDQGARSTLVEPALDPPFPPIGRFLDWIKRESIDLRGVGFRMRIIEPDPDQLVHALQRLPELVAGHLHEVLIPPPAA